MVPSVGLFNCDLRHLVRRCQHKVGVIDAVLSSIGHPDDKWLEGSGSKHLTYPRFHVQTLHQQINGRPHSILRRLTDKAEAQPRQPCE